MSHEHFHSHPHHAEVDRLYDLLQRRADVLREEFGNLPTPRDVSTKRKGTPAKGGVYFYFEQGEQRAGEAGLRVVRIGRTSSLESRLVREHAKDWGRSRFRMQVGAALLRKGKFDGEIDPTDRDRWVEEWYRHIPAGRGKLGVHDRPDHLHPTLHALHPMVTHTIANMKVVWIEIPEKEEQEKVEKECIMLLSNSLRSHDPINPPSDQWLGSHAREAEVRTSGLWNVHHTKKPHSPGFLDDFQKHF